ncbi:TIGR00304 family membrane protein [Methanohalophilus sp.]
MNSAENSIIRGFVLTAIGFFLLFLGLITKAIYGNGAQPEFGGLVLIGPIPIVIGSSEGVSYSMLLLGLFIFAIYILLWRANH